MNKLKKPVAQPRRKASSPQTIHRRKAVVRVFRSLNVFGYLEIRSVVNTMPFIFFLSAMALFFIGNGYYAENTIREIDKVGKEIKELKSESVTSKSDLMQVNGQSQVAAAVAPLALEESREAPVKILVPPAPSQP